MALMTQSKFAEHMGVNKSTVSRWVSNGRVELTPGGLIDPDAAKRSLSATESPAPAVATETKAAFAARLGVNKSTITRAAQAGRIVIDARGMVLVEESLRRWDDMRGLRPDLEAYQAEKRGHAIDTRLEADDYHADDPSERTPADPAMRDVKAQILAAEIHLMEHDNALRKRKRLERVSVNEEAEALGAYIRAAVERMIDEITPRLVVVQSEVARGAMLGESVRELQRRFKRRFYSAARRLMRPA